MLQTSVSRSHMWFWRPKDEINETMWFTWLMLGNLLLEIMGVHHSERVMVVAYYQVESRRQCLCPLFWAMSWFASWYAGPLSDVIPIQLLASWSSVGRAHSYPKRGFFLSWVGTTGLGIGHQSSIPFNLFTAFHLSPVTTTEKTSLQKGMERVIFENKKWYLSKMTLTVTETGKVLVTEEWFRGGR